MKSVWSKVFEILFCKYKKYIALIDHLIDNY